MSKFHNILIPASNHLNVTYANHQLSKWLTISSRDRKCYDSTPHGWNSMMHTARSIPLIYPSGRTWNISEMALISSRCDSQHIALYPFEVQKVALMHNTLLLMAPSFMGELQRLILILPRLANVNFQAQIGLSRDFKVTNIFIGPVWTILGL